MAVLVSLERKIALDLRHAFEIIIDNNELSVLYMSGGEVLKEAFKLPQDTDTNGLLRFLAEFKNLPGKVVIYEDLVDGSKQTREEEKIRKLKAEKENLKKTICDLMGDIQRMREQLEEKEDEEDEIIPVVDGT